MVCVGGVFIASVSASAFLSAGVFDRLGGGFDLAREIGGDDVAVAVAVECLALECVLCVWVSGLEGGCDKAASRLNRVTNLGYYRFNDWCWICCSNY